MPEEDESIAANNLLVILESEGCQIGVGMGSITRIFRSGGADGLNESASPQEEYPQLDLGELSGAGLREASPARPWVAMVRTNIGPVGIGADAFLGIEDLGTFPVVPLARLADGSFGIHLQLRQETPLMIFAPDFLAQRVQERTT